MTYNERSTYQDLQDAAKGVLGQKFIALNAFIGKEDKYKISDLRSHLRKLEKKKEQSKPKVGRGKEVIKVKTEIYGRDRRQRIEEK